MLIRGPTIHAGDGPLPGGALRIAAGKISLIAAANRLPDEPDQLVFPADHALIPGLIDLHVHGAAGADTMDADPASLATISQALARTGVTGFLATTMTDTPAAISAALRAVAATDQTPGAALLGIHLEGPFLSPRRPGAQRAERMIRPDPALFERWQADSGGRIRLVTLAPELDGAPALVDQLQRDGVVVSAGHTDATYEQTVEAIARGCTQATHLFNAMAPLTQRAPGPAAALLEAPEVRVELIADGVHLHPAVLRLVYRAKGPGGILLITDGMRATGQGDGQFTLGGQHVTVCGREARLADGTLAGSVLTMPDALRQMRAATGCGMAELIRMAAENPARQLGLFDRKGSLAVGKDADLLLLDAAGAVAAVWRGGARVA